MRGVYMCACATHYPVKRICCRRTSYVGNQSPGNGADPQSRREYGQSSGSSDDPNKGRYSQILSIPMGLDAAVYRRLEELPFTKDDLRFVEVDPRTGQVDFEDAALFRAWSDKVKVVQKRIGNIAMVNRLKAELERIFGDSSPETLLISKVLYSGTHSGDVIP